MKKIFYLFLIVGLLLCGCGKEKTQEDKLVDLGYTQNETTFTKVDGCFDLIVTLHTNTDVCAVNKNDQSTTVRKADRHGCFRRRDYVL